MQEALHDLAPTGLSNLNLHHSALAILSFLMVSTRISVFLTQGLALVLLC